MEIPVLPKLPELDEEPTIQDLEKAVDKLSMGKAPGADGIPPEVIKRCETIT